MRLQTRTQGCGGPGGDLLCGSCCAGSRAQACSHQARLTGGGGSRGARDPEGPSAPL